MDIVKANWTKDDNAVVCRMPINKIDEATRTVSGYATLDNVDREGDVIRADASIRAFERFRGNVREMHQPNAVGKVVKFYNDQFYDQATDKFYNGMAVSVYVSKGAEDTWQKVLDGTLSGFSVRGDVKDSESLYVDNVGGGQVVNFINDYDLVELSLVDSPSNQLANVFAIQKSDTGEMTMTGLATDVELKEVFWCGEDEVAKTSVEESATCNFCGTEMEQIGWVESSADDNTEAVKEVIAKFLSENKEKDEGRIEKMTEENKEAEREQPQGVTTSGDVGLPKEVAEPKPDGANEAGSEEPTVTPPVEVEEPDFSKMLEEVRKSFEEGIQKGKDETQEVIKALESRVESVEKSLGEKTKEFDETVKGLTEKLTAAEEHSDKVEKSLGELQGSSAIKKSSDVGSGDGALTREKKEFSWSGSFASADEL
jgi:hypothetical protein